MGHELSLADIAAVNGRNYDDGMAAWMNNPK